MGVKNFKNCKVIPPTIKHKRVKQIYANQSAAKKLISQSNDSFENFSPQPIAQNIYLIVSIKNFWCCETSECFFLENKRYHDK